MKEDKLYFCKQFYIYNIHCWQTWWRLPPKMISVLPWTHYWPLLSKQRNKGFMKVGQVCRNYGSVLDTASKIVTFSSDQSEKLWLYYWWILSPDWHRKGQQGNIHVTTTINICRKIMAHKLWCSRRHYHKVINQGPKIHVVVHYIWSCITIQCIKHGTLLKAWCSICHYHVYQLRNLFFIYHVDFFTIWDYSQSLVIG